jgi:ribulose-phosphate 3-epimerase
MVGFGGQELQERSLQKLTAIRSWADKNKKDTSIVIDGGVNDKTKTMVKDAGANVLVAGSYLFKGNNLEEGALRDV